MEKMLEINHLMVFYENAIALNDLGLEVYPGEMLAVLGSNGAGKTCLMDAVSGLLFDMKKKEERKAGERITIYGEIKFEGEDILNLKPSERVKRGIVLVRERHPVFPDSDVYENLKIGGYLRRRDEIEERMEFVMNLFPPLVKLRKRKGGFLSGGEQQMLAIGMALVAKPRVLLMDEPLLGLSPLFQENLAEAMVNIHREGVTVFLTEQFARPILPIIHRGYVVENGMLTFAGTRQELADNPDVLGGYIGT